MLLSNDGSSYRDRFSAGVNDFTIVHLIPRHFTADQFDQLWHGDLALCATRPALARTTPEAHPKIAVCTLPRTQPIEQASPAGRRVQSIASSLAGNMIASQSPLRSQR